MNNTNTNAKDFTHVIASAANWSNKDSNGIIKCNLGSSFLLITSYCYVPVSSVSGQDVITSQDINSYLESKREP
jgi:hypothetical protein